MNTNFFTEQFGFQKSLINPSNDIGAKKDYATALKKNEFNTSRSKQQGSVEISEKNKKFAEMMDAIKKKDKSKSSHSTSTTKENNDIKATPAYLLASNVQISNFHTEQTAVILSQSDDKVDTVNLNNEDPQIDLLNIAALNEEIQRLINEDTPQNDSTTPNMGRIEEQLTVNTAEIVETGTDKIENIFSIIAALLSNKNDGEKGSDDNALISIAKKIVDISKASGAAAITNGLTNEELTQLQEYIQKYSNNDGLTPKDIKDLEELVNQFINISPPIKSTKEASFDKNTQETSLQPVPTKLLTSPTPKEQNTGSRYDDRYDIRYDAAYNKDIDNSSDKSDFKTELKGAAIKNAGISSAKAQDIDNAQSSGQSFLQMTALAQGDNITIDGATQQNTGLTSLQNTQSPLQNSMTNVITQSQNAGANHPATQMVSATIQRALKAGENTNIKLRLDPPELGRVEVKMSIDKDNITKVVLTAEKPETYMLLKQDTDILQRALSNAGLNADGNLSFELADDGHDFSDNRQGDSNQGKSRHDNDIADNGLIETSLDWQIDPQTGRMRYNALV